MFIGAQCLQARGIYGCAVFIGAVFIDAQCLQARGIHGCAKLIGARYLYALVDREPPSMRIGGQRRHKPNILVVAQRRPKNTALLVFAQRRPERHFGRRAKAPRTTVQLSHGIYRRAVFVGARYLQACGFFVGARYL